MASFPRFRSDIKSVLHGGVKRKCGYRGAVIGENPASRPRYSKKVKQRVRAMPYPLFGLSINTAKVEAMNDEE